MRSNAVDQKIRESETEKKKAKKKKKRKRIITTLVIIALIVVIGGMCLNQFVVKPAKKQVAKKLTESVVEQALTNAGVSDDVQSKAEEIVNSMAPEDQKTVENIVSNHMTPSEINEAASVYKSEGTSGLKDYAEKTLSDQEISEIQGLYDKYKDSISPEDLGITQ